MTTEYTALLNHQENEEPYAAITAGAGYVFDQYDTVYWFDFTTDAAGRYQPSRIQVGILNLAAGGVAGALGAQLFNTNTLATDPGKEPLVNSPAGAKIVSSVDVTQQPQWVTFAFNAISLLPNTQYWVALTDESAVVGKLVLDLGQIDVYPMEMNASTGYSAGQIANAVTSSGTLVQSNGEQTVPPSRIQMRLYVVEVQPVNSGHVWSAGEITALVVGCLVALFLLYWLSNSAF
jgi:hypothetical protein